MGWDEWDQIKSDVAARNDGGTQLNSTSGSDGPADLRTHSQGKKAAINALEVHIRPGLRRVGVHADDSTNSTEREFLTWDTGSGLKDAHEEWARQVEMLQTRLEGDQAALTQAKSDFRFVDHEVHGQASSVTVNTSATRRDA
ncbi:hypothetical protein ABZ705_15340 [Streptomyces sp. NPDC006984]|uniref:hypothetical protein n=1 Tax=Streptomyces sp. NPDC006984 TaxID=3155463 RepID=UPI0033C0A9A7